MRIQYTSLSRFKFRINDEIHSVFLRDIHSRIKRHASHPEQRGIGAFLKKDVLDKPLAISFIGEHDKKAVMTEDMIANLHPSGGFHRLHHNDIVGQQYTLNDRPVVLRTVVFFQQLFNLCHLNHRYQFVFSVLLSIRIEIDLILCSTRVLESHLISPIKKVVNRFSHNSLSENIFALCVFIPRVETQIQNKALFRSARVQLHSLSQPLLPACMAPRILKRSGQHRFTQAVAFEESRLSRSWQ